MTVVTATAPAAARKAHPSVLVSAPGMKFVIGLVAALCAVFFPRLIAALTAADHPRPTFVSQEYLVVAFSFSALVALVVTILEWRVPRAPADTFLTTLGLPAMLAGALSASQGTTALQQAADAKEKLAEELANARGIKIESTNRSGGGAATGVPQALADALVTPVYAEGLQAAQAAQQQPSRLGIYVAEPQYYIVLDRAPKREDAQARLAEWTARLARTPAQPAVTLRVEQQGAEFLVVESGGPRPRTTALLEALRLKDAYHVAPTLVPARTQ